jgi:hypothetical protein
MTVVSRRGAPLALACLAALAGCAPDDPARASMAASAPSAAMPMTPDGAQPDSAVPSSAEPSTQPSSSVPSGAAPNRALPALCSRPGADKVHDVFCAASAPAITGLVDLQQALGLTFPSYDAGTDNVSIGYGGVGSVRVVLLAHSTALSGDVVSPLNPRAIMIADTTFIAFNRGVQQVELASLDRTRGRMNLYLVGFDQACNGASRGCSPGDLFTPRIESNWTSVTVRDDEDLKNTPSDCRQCHQRNRDTSALLMRELDGPWTHYFGPDQEDTADIPEPSGTALLRDYLGAKGDEPYGGVPSAILRRTIGFTLENLVNIPQPLLFDASSIMNERWPWTKAAGYTTRPVRSPTWDAAYEAFKRGEQLALPYFAPRATDPDKQARLSDAYSRYRAGTLLTEDLPDLGDIFPDDAQTRAEIGLQSEPGATPAQALVQACGACHNDVLDQSLSRARFNIDLAHLERAELDAAIDRLRLPRGVAGSMPPPGRRQVDPGALPALLDYLKANQRSSDDDALLQRAAQLGMAQISAAPSIF